jgi:heat shock protein HtpX
MDRQCLLEHRLRNELQQLGLLAVLAVILGYLSWVIGGESFMRGALTGVGVLYLVGQVPLILSIPALILGLATPSSGALLLLLAAPTLSALAQLALSRNREFEADRSAAELSSDPLGLASALDKLELYQGRFWEQMMLPDRSLPEPTLLCTHPPTAQRIERLMELVSQDDRLPRHISLPREDPWELLPLLSRGIDRTPRWHITGLWH